MTSNTLGSFRFPTRDQWRDVALPREHGSWSLALEPLTLGLLAAPSAAGGWFALAVFAGFLARRPLRIAWREQPSSRRDAAASALLICALAALAAVSPAVAERGFGWLAWLVPSTLLGGFFVSRDVRNAGREEAAEIAGAAAFALLAAPMALLGGSTPATALALAVIMTGRAVPTVMTVRAALRSEKTGVRRDFPALFASSVAFAVACGLASFGRCPWSAALALGIVFLRAFALLAYPRPRLRARTIGMIEAALGLGFVILAGTTWTG
jgi:hypothetical protein